MASYEFKDTGLEIAPFNPKRVYPADTRIQIVGKAYDRIGKLKEGLIALHSPNGSSEGIVADPRLGGSEQFAGLPDVIRPLVVVTSYFERLKPPYLEQNMSPHLGQEPGLGWTVPTPGSELKVISADMRVIRTGIEVVRASVITPPHTFIQERK